MFSLKQVREEFGSVWSIWRNLATGSLDHDLVIPRPAGRAGNGIAGHQRYLDSDRVVILGFAYDFVAANGNGFDVVSRDYASPVGTPAQFPTNRIIFGSRATTAITRCALAVPECFIALDGGVASPALKNAADLHIDMTATGPTTGFLAIWGTLLPENHPLLANNYFGSPFNAGSSPPN
jgi:hypothetical protein